MKFILIKAGGKAEVVEMKGKRTIDYLKMKELLEIESPVTVVERKIGSKYYDLWLDDEGLLKPSEDRILGGILADREHKGAHEILVGNILILKHDKEGNSIGLTDSEIEEIMRPMYMISADDYNRLHERDLDKDLYIHGYFDNGSITVKAHSQWVVYGL